MIKKFESYAPKMHVYFIWGSENEIKKNLKNLKKTEKLDGERVERLINRIFESSHSVGKTAWLPREDGSRCPIIVYKTYSWDAKNYSLIKRINILNHEIVHFVEHYMEKKGIEDSEFLAYAISDILEWALRNNIANINLK